VPEPYIRPYRPADRAAVTDICIRTGDSGQDARPRYRDPEVLPAIFVLPYVELEPQFAFVLDDGAGAAVGYVVGVGDTAEFARRFAEEWLPTVADRFPEPADPASDIDEQMASLLHHPERMVHAELTDHPAHLHIDLLPSHQGAGFGRKLITTLFAAMHEHGIPRVYLQVAVTNTAAQAFYDRMGFVALSREPQPGGIVLGRSTAPVPTASRPIE
jgi:ribosomal protein S18 acetylase RimI-like enzyme